MKTINLFELCPQILMALFLTCSFPAAYGQEQKKPTNSKIENVPTKAAPIRANQALMQQKLSHAQSLLKGIALEDFASIINDAQTLAMIAKASNWYNTDSVDYLRHFKNFEEALDFLKNSAEKKNLEGVAMGYVRITLTCMQCHNNVRAGRKSY